MLRLCGDALSVGVKSMCRAKDAGRVWSAGIRRVGEAWKGGKNVIIPLGGGEISFVIRHGRKD